MAPLRRNQDFAGQERFAFFFVVPFGQTNDDIINIGNGESGIRTHVPLRTNGFQDRLVMTTSIQLHVSFIQLYVTLNIGSGGTFGGTSKISSTGRARKVLILLVFYR